MNTGNIVQVIGPVVDVDFSASTLPKIYEALEIMFDVNGVSNWPHCSKPRPSQ